MEVTYKELLQRKDNLDYQAIEKNNQEIQKFTKKMMDEINGPKCQNVVIFSDFDTDGIYAAQILARAVDTFTSKCQKNIVIGDRFSGGYGIPMDIELLKGDLVICLDIGSSERDKLESILKDTGIAPFVIDHHEIAENLKGYAKMLNFTGREHAPDYCSTGLAYKIYQSILNILTKDMPRERVLDVLKNKEFEMEFNTVKAFAGIATVADMVKVNNPYDDNRTMVLETLDILGKMENVEFPLGYFIENTCGIAQSRLTTETLQFGVIPYINAMGRMETYGGQKVFEAFYSEDKNQNVEILNHMKEVNIQRKNVVKEEIASKEYETFLEEYRKNPKGIAIYVNPNIAQGIAGLIAAELVKELEVPSVCVTKNAQGTYTASGRNATGFPNMFELCKIEGYQKFGGHDDALGFCVTEENLPIIKERLEENYKGIVREPVESEMLCEKDLKTMTPDKLYALEPFGVDYEKIHVETMVKVVEHRNLKNGYESFYGESEEKRPNLKYFGKALELQNGDMVKIDGILSLNEYCGKRSLQVNVECAEERIHEKDEKETEVER